MQINSKMNGVICKLLVIGIFIAISSFTLFAQTSGTIKGAGSGFIVDPEGYILTNYHVIEGAETITVYMDGRAYQPTVVATAEASDLALLKIPASGLTPVVLGNSLLVQLLDPVVAMGYPLPQYGRDLSVSEGKITAIRTNVEGREGRDTLQHDAVITHGSSGGPLFNMKGEVIGVNFGGVEGSGLQFAIPVNEAVPLLRNIPNFNPANMGTATQTLTPHEILSHYSPSVVYIETAIEFSWLTLLPNPRAIPGFPNEEVEQPSITEGVEGVFETSEVWPPYSVGDYAFWLEGLGFHVVGFAGMSAIPEDAQHWGNRVYLFAFEGSDEASCALSLLVNEAPPHTSDPFIKCQDAWHQDLAQGSIHVNRFPGEHKLSVSCSECKVEKIDIPTASVSISGKIAFCIGKLVYYIHTWWSEAGTLQGCLAYHYDNGWLFYFDTKLINVNEVTTKLQELANLVAITAYNKLTE